MKKTIKLTESDLIFIIKNIIKEDSEINSIFNQKEYPTTKPNQPLPNCKDKMTIVGKIEDGVKEISGDFMTIEYSNSEKLNPKLRGYVVKLKVMGYDKPKPFCIIRA
jgi:hypothetical protein